MSGIRTFTSRNDRQNAQFLQSLARERNVRRNNIIRDLRAHGHLVDALGHTNTDGSW